MKVIQKLSITFCLLILFSCETYYLDGKKRINKFTGTVEYYRESTIEIYPDNFHENHTLSVKEISDLTFHFEQFTSLCDRLVYGEERCNNQDNGEYELNWRGVYLCSIKDTNLVYLIRDGCGLDKYNEKNSNKKFEENLTTIIKDIIDDNFVSFSSSVKFDELPKTNRDWINNKIEIINKIVISNVPTIVYKKGWTKDKIYLNGRNTYDDDFDSY